MKVFAPRARRRSVPNGFARKPAAVSRSAFCKLTIAAGVVLNLLPATLWAQGGASGSLVGTVVDQTGLPMGGVKVSARSDTQIGGAKTAYTNSSGEFRFVALSPGVFEVTAAVPKMKTLHHKGIHIGVNAPAEVNLMMEVEASTEEVKVIERAPAVSTKSAAVKEIYDEEFVDQIPSDFKAGAESVIGNAVPGANPSGDFRARGARIRGGGVGQTAFQVEGFHMNGQRSTLKGMAALEIQSAGYGAENATIAGGVVNMVTKSGSNKHEIDLNAYGENNRLTFFLDNQDSRERSYSYVFNPNVSGPIVKDKLWYFVNLEARPEMGADGPDPQGLAPRTPDSRYFSVRGSAKLTWQISARNKLVSFTNFNIRSTYNSSRGYDPYTEPEAQTRQDDRDIFTGFIWESLLTDSAFLKSQIGVSQFHQQAGPQLCQTDPKDCDHVPAVIQTFPRQINSGNASSRTQTVAQRLQFINTLQFFPSSRRFGDHDIKLKNDYYIEQSERASSTPGNRVAFFNGTTPDRQQEFFSNDPRIEDARQGWFIRTSGAWKNVLSLSDSMRIARYLTLTPGIALTRAKAFNSLGETPFDVTAFTPHFSAAWDATQDGRTVLRGSFNQYLDVDAAGVANFTVGSAVSQTCRWDEATRSYSRECAYAGGLSGRTVGLPCGPTGYDAKGLLCRQKLEVPRTWEYTVGAEREIIQGVALGGDMVYRKYTNQYEIVETNRIWNRSGTALESGGAYRNGRPEIVQDMQTPEGARRSYLGNTISLHKREGVFKVSVGYTMSFLRGNVFEGNNNFYGDIGPRDLFLDGYLPDDSRHNVRMTSTYKWTKWLTTGLIYDYRSGRPYQRRYRNVITGGYEDYRARVGINPGSNINDPLDDRELRLPDVQQLSMQIRTNWLPLIGYSFETYADILNVLALRTTTAVVETEPPSGGLQPDGLRLSACAWALASSGSESWVADGRKARRGTVTDRIAMTDRGCHGGAGRGSRAAGAPGSLAFGQGFRPARPPGGSVGRSSAASTTCHHLIRVRRRASPTSVRLQRLQVRDFLTFLSPHGRGWC